MPPLVPDKRDEFQPTGKEFSIPSDLGGLDPVGKRQVAICSFFAHQNLAVRDISRILGVEYGMVVKTLIEEGLILERRMNKQRPTVENGLPFFPES